MRPLPLFLFATLVAGLAAAATPATVFVTIDAQGDASFTGPPGSGETIEAVPGERYAWNLSLATEYTVVELRADRDAFDVERARQLVPELDDRPQHPDADHLHPHFFTEVEDPTEADGPARLVNFTEKEGAWVLRLGVPGPGNATLHLRRDVAAPAFEVDAPTGVTHFSFLVEARTDEFAFGDLLIRPAEGGDEVRNPTTTPALRQTFPVQGLDPDTEYVYRVRFEDWAGNVNETGELRVRTLPKPPGPPIALTDPYPPPGAVLDAPVPEVRVNVSSPESPVTLDMIRLFVDKREVSEDVTFEDGVVRYRPAAPLGPGLHSASVEVVNEGGGEARLPWTFTVETETPAWPLAALAALAVAAVRTARRRA